MELVGATGAFIRIPFLLEGMMQGVLGGILAYLVLYVLVEYSVRFTSIELADAVHRDVRFLGGVVVAGVLLGLIGSTISVIRFIRRASGSAGG
jgi:cell division transport system permease protein